MTSINDEIKEIIHNSINKAFLKGVLLSNDVIDFSIEVPNNKEYGDFSTNVAMISSKIFKLSPKIIANIICDNIDLNRTSFYKFDIAGPGFINFFIKQDWLSNNIINIINQSDNYGRSDYGKSKKVMIEFVSANPTGPMHIGNSRGGAIGDCLASVFDFAGYDVTREFYINDTGNQIEKFKDSLYARYMQIIKGEENFNFPEDGYHGDDIRIHSNKFYEIHGDKFFNIDPEEVKNALVDYALPINISNLKSDLEKYRINYDVWFSETSLYINKTIDKVIDILKSNNLTYEKDGALWYNLKKSGCEKDEVLVRANKTPTYFLSDIAYHYNKFIERDFDKVINIWGADHHGHVSRLKFALNDLGIDSSKLDIVLMQLVRLVRNGETIRVSKRTGKSITLIDLLEEVPISAARFFFNLKESNSHFDFDLDLAIEQSSKNPVYYVQYAYARICSIIKKFKDLNIEILDIEIDHLNLLCSDEEKELIKFMSKFPNEIIKSANSYDPSKITKYSIELATLFHKFYNFCKVNCDDVKLSNARYRLCEAVKIVLKNIFNILKIDILESM